MHIQNINQNGEIIKPETVFTIDGIPRSDLISGELINDGNLLVKWVCWDYSNHHRNAYIQKLDVNGNRLFPGPVLISEDNNVNTDSLQASTDKEGNTFFSWGSSKNIYSVEHSSIQKINDQRRITLGEIWH